MWLCYINNYSSFPFVDVEPESKANAKYQRIQSEMNLRDYPVQTETENKVKVSIDGLKINENLSDIREEIIQ